MAKKEKTVKVKALVNLKYDEEFANVGETLAVRISDLKSMMDNGYVEALEDIDSSEQNEDLANEE